MSSINNTKFINSVTGGHSDYVPLAPKIGRSWLFIKHFIQSQHIINV